MIEDLVMHFGVSPTQAEMIKAAGYCRPESYTADAIKTELTFREYEQISTRLLDIKVARLLHSVMGLVTEAGELMDVLKKHLIYGKPIDWINVQEEFGDTCWYLALGIDNVGCSWSEIWDQNIRKLRARYGERFTESAALNRDLELERRELES